MVYFFTITTLAINSILLFIIPLKLTRQELYTTWLAVTLNVLLADLIFGHVLDLYDLMDPGPQLFDLLIEITLPATFGILYVNFMPKARKKFLLYLLVWAGFSVCYEVLSSYFGYVVYKGWQVWWSAIYYIGACLYMRWHFRFMRKERNPL
ncbi:hypothetical protein QUF73_13235 [Cytobacillus sp. NJ13]|nr:hypothetical protein [Cytobacillus sp. NJ13]